MVNLFLYLYGGKVPANITKNRAGFAETIQPMKITLLLTGKTEEAWLREGIRDYASRIGRYVPFDLIELPALRNARSLPVTDQKKKEAAAIMEQVGPSDYVVLLDEQGQVFDSVGFSAFLNKQFGAGRKQIVFVIGGPYGAAEPLKQRADVLLSLSRMTFSHQMVRLIFVEQVYRAMTILRNESYHHV